MKKTFTLVVFLLALTALACGFNFSTANISEATLAKDEAGDEPTTTFAQDDSFYAVVEVANAPDSTIVKAEWIAVDADGVDPNFVIGEKELEGGGTLAFSLSNDKLWPVGQYKVDVYLNDELERTLEFTVEGDVVAEQPEPEPEPTATPEPEPTATPEPEESPANQAGDSLGGQAPDADLGEGVFFEETFDSDEAGWETGQVEDDYSVNEAVIEDGRYQVTVEAIQTAYVEKFLVGQDFSDFSLMMEATPADSAEHYSYGVSFRVNEDGHGYTFEIGNDGLYSVSVYDGEWQTLVDWTQTKAIEVGQTNIIGVIAQGDNLEFYVNGNMLTSLEDDTVSTGQVAVVVDIFEEEQSATVEFDNLLIGDPALLGLEGMGAEPDAGTETDLITFADEPYEHPSGAFSFAMPVGWRTLDEFDTGINLVSNLNTDTLIGSIFVDAGFVHTRDTFQEFIDQFIDSFIEGFGDSYDVVEQTGDPNDQVFVSTTYQAEDGDGNIEFLFMQRKTVVFALVFITPADDTLRSTWEEIRDSYTVDPDAALAAAPAAPEPTPPPAPVGPSVPAGKGMFLFRNQTGVDFVVDVIGPTNTSQVIPPNSSHEFILDPGSYIINGHSPGGQYAIDAYSFELAAGQVFPLNLN